MSNLLPNMMFKLHSRIVFVVTAGLLISMLISCKKSEEEQPNTEPSSSSNPLPTNKAVHINKYQATALTKALWIKGGEHLKIARDEISQLKFAIDELLTKPEPEKMQQAQMRWNTAMKAFEQFFVYMQLARVHPEHFSVLHSYHSSVAAWPIQPGYLDAFGRYQYSGIVFDVQLPINESSLRGQHGLTDLNEVTLGLYALEFILAGETHQRSALAFVPLQKMSQADTDNGYEKIEELPRNRRRELLRVQAELLAKDIKGLHTVWTSSAPDALRLKFTHLSPDKQIQAFIQSAVYGVLDQIKALSELSRQNNHHHDPDNYYRSSLQQAERLLNQVSGMKLFAQIIGKEFPMEQNIALLDKVSKDIKEILNVPSPKNGETPPKISWKPTYSSLKQLAETMLGTTSAHPPSLGAPKIENSEPPPDTK